MKIKVDVKIKAEIEIEPDEMLKAIKQLSSTRAIIGIPDSEAEREDDEETGDINNAAIAFINEFGDPGRNIPARPHAQPGIEEAQEEGAELIEDMLSQQLLDPEQIIKALESAAILSVNRIQAKFTDNEWPAPAPLTLALRAARGFEGESPLIETGQLRRSYTYFMEKD